MLHVLDSVNFSQTIVEPSEILVLINREALPPHKKILGNNFPSFGQVTTWSAYGITGFVITPPNRVTVTTSVIDKQGAIAVL